MIRPLFIALLCILILVCLLNQMAGQGGTKLLDTVTAEAEQRPAKLDETPAPAYTLPDPLKCADGTAVSDADIWSTKRRTELLQLFTKEIYGRTPLGKPEGMHFEVESNDIYAFDGTATRKEVTIYFSPGKGGPAMHLLIYQPKGVSLPVFLGLNFYGNHTVNSDPGITLSNKWIPSEAPGVVNNKATEAARGSDASKWLIEEVVAHGYASVTAYCGELCPDNPNGLKEGINGWKSKTGTEDRDGEAWGAIGVWAWGLSRALDYIETDPSFDPMRVAVHGHSRLGKAALWAGAKDQRFAMVISNESGCGGAALSKRIHGETVADINRQFPHWFCKNFRNYNGKENSLPIDQHELLALVAPRPLYVTSAEEDDWADPRGEFLAVKAAEPVYALFKQKGPALEDVPEVNKPAGGALRYHVRTGKHDMTAYDWAYYVKFADRWMKRR
ncbi:MAG: acetylxylan esterase [Opitutaceae bacterium]|jgi:hypothetical protein